LYSIIDIETTGGNHSTGKITEIAIYVHDGEKIIREFTSLINPEKPIPPFIAKLTGITDSMVASSPKFYEVAKEIVEITEGTVFVAHNVNYDYNFVREEFRQLGFNYHREQLCTVKLSRKLMPEEKSYSLGKLCRSLGINNTARHRASGDALATVQLFERLLTLNSARNKGDKFRHKIALAELNSHLRDQIIEQLPEETGLYFFYNSKNDLIYIGKSNNIRRRVIQHLNNSKSVKGIRMIKEIADITFEITGSEILALLKESDFIKKHKPKFNRARKNAMFPIGLYVDYGHSGLIKFFISKRVRDLIPLLNFKSEKEANAKVDLLLKKERLCSINCAMLDSKRDSCLNDQLKLCCGGYSGKSNITDYNKKAEKFIDSIGFRNKSFILIDSGKSIDEKAIILVKEGKIIGYNFFDIENSYDLSDIENSLIQLEDNQDSKQIMRSFLKSENYHKIKYL